MHYWSFMIIIGICAAILIFVILKYRNINEILKDKINTINKLECENKKLNNDTKELIEQNAKLQTAIEYEKKINQEKIDDLIALKEQTKNESQHLFHLYVRLLGKVSCLHRLALRCCKSVHR